MSGTRISLPLQDMNKLVINIVLLYEVVFSYVYISFKALYMYVKEGAPVVAGVVCFLVFDV